MLCDGKEVHLVELYKNAMVVGLVLIPSRGRFGDLHHGETVMARGVNPGPKRASNPQRWSFLRVATKQSASLIGLS